MEKEIKDKERLDFEKWGCGLGVTAYPQGSVYYINLDAERTSYDKGIMGKCRPCIIISGNDYNNNNPETYTVIPTSLSAQRTSVNEVMFSDWNNKIRKAIVNQIITVHRSQISDYLFSLSEDTLDMVLGTLNGYLYNYTSIKKKYKYPITEFVRRDKDVETCGCGSVPKCEQPASLVTSNYEYLNTNELSDIIARGKESLLCLEPEANKTQDSEYIGELSDIMARGKELIELENRTTQEPECKRDPSIFTREEVIEFIKDNPKIETDIRALGHNSVCKKYDLSSKNVNHITTVVYGRKRRKRKR